MDEETKKKLGIHRKDVRFTEHPESENSFTSKYKTGTLKIHDWSNFTEKIKQIFEEVKMDNSGNVADYIPQLANVDENLFSLCVVSVDGQVLELGDSNHAFSMIKKAYPAAEKITDLLDGALMNAGPIIHPPLIMMNAGPLEHFDVWDIHNEGTQPSIRSVTNALDEERISLRKTLGYKEPHFPLKNHYDDTLEEWMYGNSSHAKLTDSGDWRENINLHTHRYMREDTALGLTFFCSLGRWVNHPMPISEGLLAIASEITGDKLYESGRSLESLGLADLNVDEMKRMLEIGITA